MTEPDFTKQTYDKIAEDWHRHHFSDDWWVAGTDHLISLLPVGATVLDVGCGAGTKVKYLREKGLTVTGFDYSEGLLKISKRENPDTEFLLMDMRELGDFFRTFDCLFAQASLLHISKVEISKIIASLLKLLKDGGYFYAAVKGVRADRSEEGIVSDEKDYGFGCRRFFSYYRPEEMRNYFEENGLRVVWENLIKTGNCQWIQIIGQKVGGTAKILHKG